MSDLIKTIASQSTCQKRVTVCLLYDADGNLLSAESNRCDPPGGVCARLGVVQDKQNYDTESTCNWSHAEARALAALPNGSLPRVAVLHGHEFVCDACERALTMAGVWKTTVLPLTEGTGIRH